MAASDRLTAGDVMEYVMNVTPQDSPTTGGTDASQGTAAAQGYSNDLWSRMMFAVAVAMCESDGDPKIVGQDPNDRGLWQINRKYHPEVTDEMAFDPARSTTEAYRISNHWDRATMKAPSGWHAASNDANWQQGACGWNALNALIKSGGTGGANSANIPGTGVISAAAGGIADGVGGLVSGVLGWAEALGKLLSKLLDPTWWRRIGVGALGVFLILIAVVLVVGSRVVG